MTTRQMSKQVSESERRAMFQRVFFNDAGLWVLDEMLRMSHYYDNVIREEDIPAHNIASGLMRLLGLDNDQSTLEVLKFKRDAALKLEATRGK